MSDQSKQPVGSWYSPLKQEEERPAEQVEKKKKKGRAGWRAVLWTLLTVGLITGSSLFFSDGAEEPLWENPVLIMPTPGTAKPAGENPAEDLPDNGPEEELPIDWKDFFASYYTIQEITGGKTDIPKFGGTLDWKLALSPAGEKEFSLQEIYERCAGSIVAITTTARGGRSYWGTGIIMSRDGLILTNAHLIEDCDSAVVTLADDTAYDALLIGTDPATDIAVLKIEASGLRPAEFGDSDALRVGESVAAIGNPLGEEFRATMTNGIVSAISRGVTHNGRTMNLLQTNTAINEGSSGGALVNMYGQVVGVTNMKMRDVLSGIEGIAFAIPSSTVYTVVNALVREGVVSGRTAVGITVGAIADFAAEHYELPDGLYISKVSKGSDAEAKGLREGDIITAVNGLPARTTEDILKAKESLAVGDSLTFTIWREGKTFDVEVRLVDQNDVY